MHTINCQDCGCPRTTTMKNTKYCRLCRLYKNLTFVKDKTANCVACEKEYALTDRKPWLCQACTTGVSDRTGQCGVCGESDTKLVEWDVAVCGSCMDDVTKRGKILLGLMTKIARNKEEYGTVDE